MIRTLMGINNIKKCTFSFLSGDAVILQLLVITPDAAFVNLPGKNIWRSSAISSELHRRSLPGAPGDSRSVLKCTQKMADFREFESLPLCSQDPGILKQDPSSTINGGFPGVWEIDISEFAQQRRAPGATYPQVIPTLLRWGVWEFEPNALVV